MIKSPQELVAEAKSQIDLVNVNEADAAISMADVVLDVREPEEFAAGHLPGAVNIPRGLLEFKIAEIPQMNSSQSHIVMYCKTDGRCALAAKTLQEMGYEQVKSLEGGFMAWVAAGKPVES